MAVAQTSDTRWTESLWIIASCACVGLEGYRRGAEASAVVASVIFMDDHAVSKTTGHRAMPTLVDRGSRISRTSWPFDKDEP